MTLRKCVNGAYVEMSEAEETAMRAEWTTFEELDRARLAALQFEAKRAAAQRALDEQGLAAALTDPNAPQEVKDYAVAVSGLAAR